jgi:uncharacterized membrane protein YqjE
MNEIRELRPLTDIVGDVARDAQELIRGEVRLAGVELERKLQSAVMALVWTFGGMFVAFAGFVMILTAAAYALSYVIPNWAAALAIGVVITAIGAALTMAGVRTLTPANLTPHRTVRNVGQDAELVKEHV